MHSTTKNFAQTKDQYAMTCFPASPAFWETVPIILQLWQKHWSLTETFNLWELSLNRYGSRSSNFVKYESWGNSRYHALKWSKVSLQLNTNCVWNILAISNMLSTLFQHIKENAGQLKAPTKRICLQSRLLALRQKNTLFSCGLGKVRVRVEQ